MTSTAFTPPQMYERLQIAILTSEQMHLHWADAGTGTHVVAAAGLTLRSIRPRSWAMMMSA
ncbi:hypothetical protein JKG47_08625 [Acidithiobacillus sp. MC6.1]|nr:hypothetical protein [Acidithiobacillus sp. MC6.1]